MQTCNPRPPVLINVRETARLLAVSDRTVWKMAKEGRFPKPVHIGASTRWRTADVEAFVRSLAEQPTE